MHFARISGIIAATGIMLLALVLPIPAAEAANDPAGFIQDLGDQAIKIIAAPGSTPETRRKQFATLFTSDFDVPTMGRLALGRYWKEATPQQQAEYLRLAKAYVVSIYSDRFSQYSGEKFRVVGEREQDDVSTIVSSVIDRPSGGPQIHIDWRVTKNDGSFKIIDVIVENLSMAITQRSEFASIIERGGGNVDVLLDLLRKKVGS